MALYPGLHPFKAGSGVQYYMCMYKCSIVGACLERALS